MKKSKMILFNILAVLLVGIFVAIYSYLYNYQLFQVAETSFESTNHHTMEIFDEYMHANQQLVNSWAEYIDSQNMTIDDAITFVRNSCHSKIISAQILWSDTYCGLSTLSNPILPNDYTVEYGTNINEGALYIPTMKSTISNARVEKKEINITSSYTNPVTGSKVVSFLQKITLQKDGKKRRLFYFLPYLLVI